MPQRFEEEHCKIEADSVMGRQYHLGEFGWQQRWALIPITFAVAAILNGSHLEILHECEEARPSYAEYGPCSYLAGTYPMDMKRRVFRSRANYGREAGTFASWIGGSMAARNLDDLVRCNVDASGFQVQKEKEGRPIKMLDALGHKRPRVEPAVTPAEA